MSATPPIRAGMDVYRLRDNRYIGCVVAVELGGGVGEAGEGGAETRPSSVHPSPGLEHEEGAETSPTERMGSKMLGEEMGPFPTMEAGNSGPVNQSAAHDYATEAGGFLQQARRFVVRPGRLNFGRLTPTMSFPVSAIRSISMERIIVDTEGDR